jgi:hypothetical protein
MINKDIWGAVIAFIFIIVTFYLLITQKDKEGNILLTGQLRILIGFSVSILALLIFCFRIFWG